VFSLFLGCVGVGRGLGGLTANGAGQFASFINQSQTATFDDQVVYHSAQWNVNAVPRIDQGNISPPANGTYSAPQTLTFSIISPQILTVTGTSQLDLSALTGGGASIGTGNKAYTTYAVAGGTGAGIDGSPAPIVIPHRKRGIGRAASR
jgi:hypothetical protein